MTYREAKQLVDYGVWFYCPKDQALTVKFGWPSRPCFCGVKDSAWDVKKLFDRESFHGVPLSAGLWDRLGEHGFLTIACLDDDFQMRLNRVPASWVRPFVGKVPWVIEEPWRPGFGVWVLGWWYRLTKPVYRLWCGVLALWWKLQGERDFEEADHE